MSSDRVYRCRQIGCTDIMRHELPSARARLTRAPAAPPCRQRSTALPRMRLGGSSPQKPNRQKHAGKVGTPYLTFILWIKAPMRPPTAPTNANGASSNSFLHPHPASRVSQYCPAASAPPCPTQNVLVQPNVPVQPPSILLWIRSARMPSQSGARFDVGNKAARKVCSAESEGHGAAIPLVVVGDFKHDQLARRLRIQALQRCKQPS